MFTLLGLQRPIFCSYKVSKSRDQNYFNTKEFNLISDDNEFNQEIKPNILPSDFKYFLKTLLANLDKKGGNNNNFSIDIESDIQKEIDSFFVAQGNVVVRTNNAVIMAEEFRYDRNLKKLYIDGNIKFKTNSQFFIAKKIEYDFLNNKGFILDVYGSIDFDRLADINLNSENEIKVTEDFSEISKIKKVKLNNSSRFSLGNLFNKKNGDNSVLNNLSEKSIDVRFKEVNNTRFFTEKININKDVWQSDKMLLTSDPFNYPQLIILNNDFKIVFDDDGISEVESKWSKLIFDKKLSIPIGRKRITFEEDQTPKWGFGYDQKNYDGFYIYRNSESIYFGENNNSKFDLKPKFFFQRSISGKTKSFPKKDKSLFSPRVEQKADLYDYFGLSGRFTSDLNDWRYILEFDTNSLDFGKIDKIAEAETILTKNLFIREKKNSKTIGDLSFFGSYRDKTRNGSLGEIIVQSSYGGRFDLEKGEDILNNSNRKILGKKSILSASYGQYSAQSKNIPFELISRDRFNLSLKRIYTFHVWEPQKKDFIDASFKYTPETIQKGFYWFLEGNLDIFRYSDNNKQDLFLVKTGPKLILGDFNKDFFDFTEIGIYPRFKFNRGQSPFFFDQTVDNRVVELVARQQIYGPLILAFTGEYSLDENTSEYDNLINPVLDLSWNRRAYNISIVYNFDSQAGGINFKIHSFNFKGLGKKFN